jgi:hypothetical protein
MVVSHFDYTSTTDNLADWTVAFPIKNFHRVLEH